MHVPLHKNQIDKLLSEKEAEIFTLKQKIADLPQQTCKQAQDQLDTKVAQLQTQHSDAIEQAELEKQKVLESVQKQVKEKLLKAKQDQQQALTTLKKKYNEQINKVLSSKEAEIQTLKRKLADSDGSESYESLID